MAFQQRAMCMWFIFRSSIANVRLDETVERHKKNVPAPDLCAPRRFLWKTNVTTSPLKPHTSNQFDVSGRCVYLSAGEKRPAPGAVSVSTIVPPALPLVSSLQSFVCIARRIQVSENCTWLFLSAQDQASVLSAISCTGNQYEGEVRRVNRKQKPNMQLL